MGVINEWLDVLIKFFKFFFLEVTKNLRLQIFQFDEKRHPRFQPRFELQPKNLPESLKLLFPRLFKNLRSVRVRSNESREKLVKSFTLGEKRARVKWFNYFQKIYPKLVNQN